MAWNPIATADIAAGKPVCGPTGFATKTKDNFEFLYGLIGSQAAYGITNGSFEIDSDANGIPDGWTVSYYPGGYGGIQATGMDGGYMWAFIHPGGAGNGGGSITSDYLNVSALVGGKVAFLHYASAAGMKNIVQILFYTGAKAYISTSVVYSSTSNPTSPTRFFSSPFVPPSTARYLKVQLIGGFTDTAVAGWAYFDDVILFREPAAIVPGDTALLSSLTERLQNGLTPVKKKEFSIFRTGSYRVRFTLSTDSPGSAAYGRVYKNGSAFGTTRSENAGTPTTYAEDLAFTAGDLCQMYQWADGTAFSGVKDFTLHGTDPMYGTVTLD